MPYKNIEDRRKAQREWAQRNKEKIKNKSKRYYEKNRKKLLEKAKIYREQNKERTNKKTKEWYGKNKGRILKERKEERDKLRNETGFSSPALNNCKNCGKKCVYDYCNSKCYQEVEYKKYVQQWLDHEITGVYKSKKYGKDRYNPTKPVMKYIHDTYIECQQCGWNNTHPKTGKVLLQIHHKDGNRENGYLENLEILCPNCHSMTDNYMNYGKGV